MKWHCVLRATTKKKVVNFQLFLRKKSASGWPGWRIFWPRNDLARLLHWCRHWWSLRHLLIHNKLQVQPRDGDGMLLLVYQHYTADLGQHQATSVRRSPMQNRSLQVLFSTAQCQRDGRLFLKWCIVEQFLNEVDVWEKHSSAAVTLQSQCIKCITVTHTQTIMTHFIMSDEHVKSNFRPWLNSKLIKDWKVSK